MTRRVDDEKIRLAQRYGFAGGYQHVEPEDLFRLGARSGDGDPELALQRRHALDVVGMVVGDEDVRELPAAYFERDLDGLGIGGVDRRGASALDIVHEVAVVVGAAHEDIDEDRQFEEVSGTFIPAPRHGDKRRRARQTL